MTLTDMCNCRLQSERQLEQRTLEESSNTYDKQLLSRIGGPNTPKRQSVSYPPGAQDPAGHERRNSQLRPLSMPERRHTSTISIDLPSSLRRPSSGAVSPGFLGWAEHDSSDQRAPTTCHGSISMDDSASHTGNYDQSMFVHEDLMEDGQMSSLNIHDRRHIRAVAPSFGHGVCLERQSREGIVWYWCRRPCPCRPRPRPRCR